MSTIHWVPVLWTINALFCHCLCTTLQIVSFNYTFASLDLNDILKIVPQLTVLNSYLFWSKAFVWAKQFLDQKENTKNVVKGTEGKKHS